MAKLPKRPFINIERACKELNCDLDEIIDCWLSNEIDCYYMLEGEKISLTKNHSFPNDDVPIANVMLLLVESSRIYQNEHITNTNMKINVKDGKFFISFKAYGPLLIIPTKSTQYIDNTVNIISQEKVVERSQSGLLTGGFCIAFHPNTKEAVTFDDVDHINGLDFPVNKLFVMRDDINKFITSSKIEIPKDSRYWINIAIYTQNHYLQQNIYIPKSKLASKIATITGKAYSTIMKNWFKDTEIKTAEELKGSNKHGNQSVNDFDLINPETRAKLIF